MKKILTIILAVVPSLLLAQLTTNNPDTVCYQGNVSIYEVPVSAGLTYNWTVISPGVIIAGQGTNQIQVSWSNANPGLIPNAVQVQAATITGCLSPIVSLDVYVYNTTIIINPVADLCESSSCVNLGANINGGTWSGSGVIGSQFCPTSTTPGTHYVMYSIIIAGCVFSTTTQINIIPSPTISPISHD